MHLFCFNVLNVRDGTKSKYHSTVFLIIYCNWLRVGFKYIYTGLRRCLNIFTGLKRRALVYFTGWRKSAITDSNGWNRIAVIYL